MDEWITVERPGYLGARREAEYKEWDTTYGKGNWRLAWKAGESTVQFLGACALYEDAYFAFLCNNPLILHQLIHEASDVYDDELSNVRSGLDYTKQETPRTHLQDIAIRRCLVRMGAWFRGPQLLRIRSTEGTHALSLILSPGRVPFHRPDLVEQPELQGWWDPESTESFYQSNKILQVRHNSSQLAS